MNSQRDALTDDGDDDPGVCQKKVNVYVVVT